jgi:hypothetical protein
VTALMQAYIDWRTDYLSAEGQRQGVPISSARCPYHGRIRRLVGFTWRHPDFGVLFEGMTRTSETAEIERVLGPVPPGFGGWALERWILPLEGELGEAAIGRGLVPATCTTGHKWAVDMGEALAATLARRATITVRKR